MFQRRLKQTRVQALFIEKRYELLFQLNKFVYIIFYSRRWTHTLKYKN